jgi:hypothetical protein
MGDAMSYPPATRPSMRMLADLLSTWGVGLRVVDGELRMRDLDERLTDADRAAVRHYSAGLVDVLTAADEPAAPETFIDTTRCPRCSADLEAVGVAYRTDHRGDLFERCIKCGETWPWGEPQVTKPP